ncbi:MAG: GvpL/GvpF family gas vesicle protein [Roseiflexaceae bacterium]
MSLYLYGIVRSGPLTISSPGVGDHPSVETIQHGDLAVVVSPASPEAASGNRRTMLAHTRVLEEVMRSRTVLPLRFGILAPDHHAIRERLLQPNSSQLIAQLQRLEGKVELSLKVLWYEQIVFRTIAEQYQEIRELRDQLANRPADQAYYERIRLGQLTEQALQQLRSADANRIITALRPLAEQTRQLDTFSERMVLNAAFLLDRSGESRFEQAIHALDQELGERMLFKIVGPVPPYNFVSLNLSWS